MTFFNKLFRKNQSHDTVQQDSKGIPSVQTSSTADFDPEGTPLHELFVDHDAPFKGRSTVASQPRNIIKDFIQKDYRQMGYKDGFEYHTERELQNGIRKIKADYLLVIDQAIDEKNSLLVKFKNKAYDVGGLDVSKKIQNEIIRCEDLLEDLKAQKELSVDDEGWVATAIHSYRRGFVSGLNDWHEGDLLLESNSIFNSKIQPL